MMLSMVGGPYDGTLFPFQQKRYLLVMSYNSNKDALGSVYYRHGDYWIYQPDATARARREVKRLKEKNEQQTTK